MLQYWTFVFFFAKEKSRVIVHLTPRTCVFYNLRFMELTGPTPVQRPLEGLLVVRLAVSEMPLTDLNERCRKGPFTELKLCSKKLNSRT